MSDTMRRAKMSDISSRERMLAALSREKPDHVPCCFMAFTDLQWRLSADDFEFFDKQSELGLDVRVHLPDMPVHFGAGVSVRTWKTHSAGERYPLLHKEYHTPSGTLTTVVQQAEDWPYGDQVPLFDEYVTPRAQKFLVTGPADLAAFRHLLVPPTGEEIAAFRETAAEYKHYADDRGLLLCGGWWDGRSNPMDTIGGQGGEMLGVDALMWTCGATAPLYWAYDEPEFLEELLDLVYTRDRQRMEIALDAGAELIIERAWYASTEFWSPRLYRRFVVPRLRENVRLVHEAGARFGYAMTSGVAPILDDLLDLDIDVLVGVDPVEGKGTDLEAFARRASGRMCLWGGVSAPMTVEQGTSEEIWRAVEDAIATCGQQGGFILSPVDNFIENVEEHWPNIHEFITAWQHLRHV